MFMALVYVLFQPALFRRPSRIHANVGLGPFVAVMFGLPLLFSADRPGAQITAEI